MSFDLIYSYDLMNKWTNEEVLTYLQKIFPERLLYSISLGWRDNRKYILKARGLAGDVIVGWY